MKRTAEDRDVGANEFLSSYFKERGLEGDAECEASRACNQRAEEARSQFKRMRVETTSGRDKDELTGEEKYNRRLENNRYSAAASRVYREVLRKEQAFTLKTVSESQAENAQALKAGREREAQYAARITQLDAEMQRVNEREAKYTEQITEMDAELQGVKQANATMRKRLAELEALADARQNTLDDAAAPAASDAEHSRCTGSSSLRNSFARRICPSLFGASQTGEAAVVRYGGEVPENTPRYSQSQTQDDARDAPMCRPPVGSVAAGALGDAPVNLRFGTESQNSAQAGPLLSSQDYLKLETPESMAENYLPGMLADVARVK